MVLQSWANALARDFIRPGGVVPRLLAEHRMSYVAFSPLAQGLLLDKFDPAKPPQFEEGDHRRNSGRFTTEKLTALKPKLALLKARFGATTEDLAAVAQRYLLNQPGMACVIPGFRNERQVACNLAAVGRELSADDATFIEQTLA
jgi:aryl-alcohol dehydrogenase-like predicted oxidoreductase